MDGLDDPAALPVLWRTKLRSRLPEVNDYAAQVKHCLDNGLIGIGWRMDGLRSNTRIETACRRIEDTPEPGWGRRAAHTVRRFGAEAQVGDFVWTRDTHGRYLLCRIAGPYRYDGSPTARAVDVHQVRSVEWAPRALNDLEVPGGVIRCFIGTGSSFSRIRDPSARQLTPYLWEKLHDRPLPELAITPAEVLTSHLDPYDVEDLVYVWLQVARKYVALPRARQRDTPAYEWTMIHRNTQRSAIAQIKTGADHVDLQALADATVGEMDTFAFATCGGYDGDPRSVTEIIDRDVLLAFAAAQPELLSARVRMWFEFAG